MATRTGNLDPSATPALAAGYEQQLNDDPRWALSEGSRHFEEKSAVFDALHKIAGRLDELHIPYAIIGGMALFMHGFRRFTDDVDVLVRKSDLKLVHEKLSGLGYLPPHRHSKHLRDVGNGVRIEFLTSGDYPGDGLEKPVAFPDPGTVAIESGSIKYINLEKLIELKLASGMTGAGRLRDLADVSELIRLLDLPAGFADRLDPYVRPAYDGLWRQSRQRFVMRLKKPDPAVPATIDDLSAMLPEQAESLKAMKRDGIAIDASRSGASHAYLVTTDPQVARKYDMIEESEYWSDDSDT
mgnify:CR=1 FL=1